MDEARYEQPDEYDDYDVLGVVENPDPAIGSVEFICSKDDNKHCVRDDAYFESLLKKADHALASAPVTVPMFAHIVELITARLENIEQQLNMKEQKDVPTIPIPPVPELPDDFTVSILGSWD